VNEASLAAAMAAEMVLKHKLTEDEIAGQAEDSIGEWDANGDFSENWLFALLTAVAATYDCKVIRITEVVRQDNGSEVPRKIKPGKIIGRKTDAEAIDYLTSYYAGEVRRFARQRGYEMLSESEEKGFYLGAVFELQARLREKKEKHVASSEKALVITRKTEEAAREYLSITHPDRQMPTIGRGDNFASFNDGREAAEKIPMAGNREETGKERKRIGKEGTKGKR
jgi:hypothetical protein